VAVEICRSSPPASRQRLHALDSDGARHAGAAVTAVAARGLGQVLLVVDAMTRTTRPNDGP
jgi:hypothetical protein